MKLHLLSLLCLLFTCSVFSQNDGDQLFQPDLVHQIKIESDNTEVYINNQLHGLYLIVEQIDKTFLNNYFADNSGTLYKTGSNGLDIKSGDSSYVKYDALIATVNNNSGATLKNELDQILDTEAFLRNNITQNIINATDNLFDLNTNYFLYHEPKADLMYFVPWDFNRYMIC